MYSPPVENFHNILCKFSTLQAGESVDGTLDNPAEGKCYIIVETDGRCKEGKLSFEVEKP